MTRKDIDPLYPNPEWIITPSGAVARWHCMGPKVVQISTMQGVQYRSLPKGGVDRMNVWHTIDFRNGDHWIPEPGYETQFQPNIRPEDIPHIVSITGQGLFIQDKPTPDAQLRTYALFRAPGSGIEDAESMQSEPLSNDGSAKQGSRTFLTLRAPIVNGRTEFKWWATVDNINPGGDNPSQDMSIHFCLQSYEVAASCFQQRMEELGYLTLTNGGWDEQRIADLEAYVKTHEANIANQRLVRRK